MFTILNNDDQLLASLKKGNEKAFSALYNKYWEKLYCVAYNRLKSQEETEDVIHDLFMDIWNNREKIEIRKSFAAYLFTALKYKIFRLIDSKVVRRNYLVNYIPDQSVFNNNVEESLNFNELYSAIEQNIEKLPKKCRVVFKLSRFKNYNVNEISQKLNISPHTAQNHINKALKILRFQLPNILSILFFLYL